MLANMRNPILLAVITALPLLSPTYGAAANSDFPYLSAVEAEVLREMNLARTRPAGYAESLAERRKYFQGKQFKQPREIAVQTQEGVGAVNDAIDYMQRIQPVGALRPSSGMSRAARDHVREQGSTGSLGHRGNDGSQTSDRVNRYGAWRTKIGENISYGQSDAREIVVQLIIDDGTPSRDHRQNMFDPDFRVVGIACGRHRKYRAMCVTTFASDYEEAAH